MNRREFAFKASAGTLLLPRTRTQASAAKTLLSGVFQITLGVPEKITPVQSRKYEPAQDRLRALPVAGACPIDISHVFGQSSSRGYLLSLPLEANELVYGFGLQLQSFMQRGLKKKPRVNADPKVDSGDSHAPVPFYVTTRGYGVLVDTARYATFYCGNKDRLGTHRAAETLKGQSEPQGSLPAEYSRFHVDEASEMLIEIPEAE